MRQKDEEMRGGNEERCQEREKDLKGKEMNETISERTNNNF